MYFSVVAPMFINEYMFVCEEYTCLVMKLALKCTSGLEPLIFAF